MLDSGARIVEIARTIGCSETTVAEVRDGKTRANPTGAWRSIRGEGILTKSQREMRAADNRRRLASLQETVIDPRDMIVGELWRPTRYNEYFASSLGRIRGPQGTLLKLQNHNQGYKSVGVRGVTILVHILVCEAFHGPRPDGMDVAHGDGVRTNNRSDNLRWATRVDNFRDKREHGTWPVGPGLVGEANGNSRLTLEQVREIRAVVQRPRGTQKRLADHYGVRSTTIASVWNRMFWQEE
jgi:hypothetical protein